MARRAPWQLRCTALLCACATAMLGACTSFAAGPGTTSTASTSSKPPPTEPAVVCTDAHIRSAVARFFSSWDRHDERLGSLFATDGILDMATKHQDTRRSSEYTEAVGPREIVALAAQQWALGESFSYRGMDIYPPQYGGGGGAEVNDVDARFADGSVQQIEEAKFNYSCAGAAFTHVVIISLDAARKP